MGNCHKRDESVPVTNFDEDKWAITKSTIHPQCYLLKNYYHPNVKLFKWIASHGVSRDRDGKIGMWRAQKKAEYLVNVYEAGEISRPGIREGEGMEKRGYLVTEEFVRLKDLTLTENQAIVIAYKSLLAYQEMLSQLGGFVARESMIYINRQGLIKVWLNENLADNQLEYPHPGITEQEFISSLLHQIFTRCLPSPNHEGQAGKIYEYIKLGLINFEEVIGKLGFYIRERELGLLVGISKEVFDGMVDGYEVREEKKGKKDRNKTKSVEENSSKLKFLVASDSPTSLAGGPKDYVKDYSQKNFAEPQPQLEQSFQPYPMVSRHGNGVVMPSPVLGASRFAGNSYVVVNESFSM